MAELHQSDVDLAWSDATDDDSHVAPRGAVRARGSRPPPLPGLPPLHGLPELVRTRAGQVALPLPPPVLPEATSTFERLPEVAVRERARNDETLIIRPRRDSRMELRPWRRRFAALAVLIGVACSAIVGLRVHRAARPAPSEPARAVPEQPAVPSPPSESRVRVVQSKDKTVAKHKAAAKSKTAAATKPAKSTKAKAPATKSTAKVTKTTKKKSPAASTKSSSAKSVTAKPSKQRRR